MLTITKEFSIIPLERSATNLTEMKLKELYSRSFLKMSRFIKFSYVIQQVDGVSYSNFSSFIHGDLNRISLSACLKISDYLQELASDIVPFAEVWDFAIKKFDD